MKTTDFSSLMDVPWNSGMGGSDLCIWVVGVMLLSFPELIQVHYRGWGALLPGRMDLWSMNLHESSTCAGASLKILTTETASSFPFCKSLAPWNASWRSLNDATKPGTLNPNSLHMDGHPNDGKGFGHLGPSSPSPNFIKFPFLPLQNSLWLPKGSLNPMPHGVVQGPVDSFGGQASAARSKLWGFQGLARTKDWSASLFLSV